MVPVRMWFKHYHTCDHGSMYDGEELMFRFSRLCWKLLMDKHWPDAHTKNISKWSRYRRYYAIKSSLFLLNSRIIHRLCWGMESPHILLESFREPITVVPRLWKTGDVVRI